MRKYLLFAVAFWVSGGFIQAQDDKYLWLEDVQGRQALDFVHRQNARTEARLTGGEEFQSIYNNNLAIYNSPAKLAMPDVKGKWVYNFWKDGDHERGIWRRSLLSSFKDGHAQWETLLDLDMLSRQDSVKWVFEGANGLYPLYNRFLVQLSNGGGDAVVIREFDADKKEFVRDGFYVSSAKGNAEFIDEHTIIVSTDFGAGTMSPAGYPRQTKIWRRGTALKDAVLIYESAPTDVYAFGGVVRDGEMQYPLIARALTFFAHQYLFWINNRIVALDLPEDCSFFGILQHQAIVQLKSDWTVDGRVYKGGTFLSLDFAGLLAGNKQIRVILEPDALSSISSVLLTRHCLVVNMLANVASYLAVYSFEHGEWSGTRVAAPDYGAISLLDADAFSDDYFFKFENFINPSSLYAGDAGAHSVKLVQSLPASFDGSKYAVKQFKARSKDGVLVPYFVVCAKDLRYDGNNPTLQYAYGGFEISIPPFYFANYGHGWLDKGGVFVLANIRGGGEFGPQWHLQAMKENRQRAYDDYFAVSEDLVARKITSPRHLGIFGASNGGLLVGVAFTERPDLYHAVFCDVPLLDMRRYSKLMAGASWMGEYGDPDKPEEWAYIKKYSPYQNLRAGVSYPEVFFYTSTADDRVHPGHARKMAAKMMDMGYPVYFYENTEGGHAGAATNQEQAKMYALLCTYLLTKLQ